MADAFTDMHQQLNGKIEDLARRDEGAVRRAVDKWISRKGAPEEDRASILSALGIEA